MAWAEDNMLAEINRVRTARGLPALVSQPELIAAAREHAADMAAHPGMLHEGSDGSYGGDRIRAHGYDWARWGEVVGWGFGGNVSLMVDWWLNSAAHAPYLLATNVADIGVGYVYEPASTWGSYWTINFGRRDSLPPSLPPSLPLPYHTYTPIVTAPAGVDLVPYLCGDGRAYRVGNGRGSFEVFQSQREGDTFYQVKAWDDLSIVEWEQFILDGAHVRRDVDTSPGNGRYYRHSVPGDSKPGAPWVMQRMRAGQSFSQAKRVQFYQMRNCQPDAANSGNVVDTIRFVEHLAEWQSVFGVQVKDVVVLSWNGGELYYYGRGYGLVAWRRSHQDEHSPAWSAISEMRPDVGTLKRRVIPCL